MNGYVLLMGSLSPTRWNTTWTDSRLECLVMKQSPGWKGLPIRFFASMSWLEKLPKWGSIDAEHNLTNSAKWSINLSHSNYVKYTIGRIVITAHVIRDCKIE